MNEAPTASLIVALQNPALYDHPVLYFRVVETHISWVLLTGHYVYKIKKPVNLGFLDFTSLEKRRHCCEEEVRLNRRLAPALYLEVVPITGETTKPTLRGTGQIIEYAVKMQEFPQEQQLDRVLQRNELNSEHVVHLAQRVAAFHRTAAIVTPEMHFGDPKQVWQTVQQNFRQILEHLDVPDDRDQLDQLQTWSEQMQTKLSAIWTARKRNGFVRECHGDLHLGNMALINNEILIFDCIEFNEDLRWIDVMSEVAFVTMDLFNRHRPDLAHRFLNDYLQSSGDYDGLQVLRFYQVYRALVRVKVASIRRGQIGMTENNRAGCRADFHQYLRLAEHVTRPIATPLIITQGLSGSGKTTISDALLEYCGAPRIRSDIERKRLFNLTPETRTASAAATHLYSDEITALTYQRLATLASTIIAAGFPVIVDACFLQYRQREQFRQLAERLRVPFVIFQCVASEQSLRQRVLHRATLGRDASEATVSVLEHQLRSQEVLRPDESKYLFKIKTDSTHSECD